MHLFIPGFILNVNVLISIFLDFNYHLILNLFIPGETSPS
jgi:hypothetical protein